MASIPVVDLSPFWQNKGVVVGQAPNRDQLQVARQIDKASREFGFLAVKNFGICKAAVDTYFKDAKELFQLPVQAKEQMRQGGKSDIGYLPPNRKEIQHGGLQASKETFGLAAGTDCAKCPNAFQRSSAELFSRLEEVNRRYCYALALALGVDINLVWEMHDSSDLTHIRFNHYPPFYLSENQNYPAVRLGAHTDFGTQTFVLLQHGASGLEVKPRGFKEWVEVRLPEDVQCLVNIGDMWETMTNGRWKAVRHRVMLRSKEQADIDRYSIACFLNPRGDLRVAPLPQFVKTDEISQYKPYIAGEYLHKQIAKLVNSVYVMEEKDPE